MPGDQSTAVGRRWIDQRRFREAGTHRSTKQGRWIEWPDRYGRAGRDRLASPPVGEIVAVGVLVPACRGRPIRGSRGATSTVGSMPSKRTVTSTTPVLSHDRDQAATRAWNPVELPSVRECSQTQKWRIPSNQRPFLAVVNPECDREIGVDSSGRKPLSRWSRLCTGEPTSAVSDEVRSNGERHP